MSRRLDVERHLAADPASVALLLAGEGSNEPDLVIDAPRRSSVGFIAAVSATDANGRPAVGKLRITPAQEPGCEVRVTMIAADCDSAAVVRRSASRFLATLALRARQRAHAA